MNSEEIKWFERGYSLFNHSNNINWPRISIVTPSYNQGAFIEETILSVIHQNYPNLEYIIIDGGSTDNTLDVIKKYEKHISHWVSEKDNGQTHAINKGFAKATGHIFNWLNSDDILCENALYKIAEHFINNKSITCLCGREIRFKNNTIINQSFGSTIHKSIEETLISAHIDQPSTYFLKSELNDIFPLNENLKYCMDTQLWLSFLMRQGTSNVLSVNDILVYFRYHTNSKTYTSAASFQKELILLLTELGKVLNGKSSEYFTNKFVQINTDTYQTLLDKKCRSNSSMAKLLMDTALNFNALNLYLPALNSALKAIIHNPLNFLYYKYFFVILSNLLFRKRNA